MCSDLAMFRELIPVSSVTVTLPNGTRVPITHTCTICISQSLLLHNVLHVPDFHFNLISVSCLVQIYFVLLISFLHIALYNNFLRA